MSDNKIEQPTYYAIIPASVRYDRKIPANAKLLYGEITCLSDKHGYCFATNDYFGELYNVDGKTISRWVSALVKQGHITAEYIRRGAEIKERRIYLADSRVIKSSLKGQKDHPSSDKKRTRSSDKKRTDITTSISITSKDILEPTGSQSEKSVIVQPKNESLHNRTVDFIYITHERIHGAKFKCDGKEMASVKKLIEAATTENPEHPEKVLEQRLRICVKKMDTATTEYWTSMKFTPSKILNRWNELTPDLPKRDKREIEQQEQDIRLAQKTKNDEIKESAEAKMKRELMERLSR